MRFKSGFSPLAIVIPVKHSDRFQDLMNVGMVIFDCIHCNSHCLNVKNMCPYQFCEVLLCRVVWKKSRGCKLFFFLRYLSCLSSYVFVTFFLVCSFRFNIKQVNGNIFKWMTITHPEIVTCSINSSYLLIYRCVTWCEMLCNALIPASKILCF